MDQKSWSDAIQVLDLGLKSFPDCRLFQQNIKYCEGKLKGR